MRVRMTVCIAAILVMVGWMMPGKVLAQSTGGGDECPCGTYAQIGVDECRPCRPDDPVNAPEPCSTVVNRCGGDACTSVNPSTYSSCVPQDNHRTCRCCPYGSSLKPAGQAWVTSTRSDDGSSPGNVCGDGNTRTGIGYDLYHVDCNYKNCDDGYWVTTNLCNMNSCQAFCVNTAPDVPTLTSPADGAQSATTTIGLFWGSVASWGTACANQGNKYWVYVGTVNPPTTLVATLESNVTSYNFVGTAGATYYWRVLASNGQVGQYSAVRSFTILDNQIVGTVYYDLNNTCGGAAWGSGGVSVSVDGGAGTAVTGSGTYSATATIGQPHTLSVSMPAGYACSTGAGCNTCSRSGIASPSTNNNFYLTDLKEAWWQAEGAGIYVGGLGGGVTVRSELPTPLTKLILAGSGGTPGALIRGSGQADLGAGTVSTDLWSTLSRYRGKRMDYRYFSANMGVIPAETSDWPGNNLSYKPTVSGEEFYYQAGASTIDAPWAVNSGESYVVFVNGDLRIASDITVASGGFLAFIVNGDITVDPSVTTIQGIYLANADFVTESDFVWGVTNDVALDVQGTIVAWGTMSLGRNLGTINASTPAEKFSYRPDLLTNMPENMKTFAMEWQEVVAGTFE